MFHINWIYDKFWRSIKVWVPPLLPLPSQDPRQLFLIIVIIVNVIIVVIFLISPYILESENIIYRFWCQFSAGQCWFLLDGFHAVTFIIIVIVIITIIVIIILIMFTSLCRRVWTLAWLGAHIVLIIITVAMSCWPANTAILCRIAWTLAWLGALRRRWQMLLSTLMRSYTGKQFIHIQFLRTLFLHVSLIHFIVFFSTQDSTQPCCETWGIVTPLSASYWSWYNPIRIILMMIFF